MGHIFIHVYATFSLFSPYSLHPSLAPFFLPNSKSSFYFSSLFKALNLACPSQAADVPLVSWCRTDTVCPSRLAAVACPVPTAHGSWPPCRWSSWTAVTGTLPFCQTRQGLWVGDVRQVQAVGPAGDRKLFIMTCGPEPLVHTLSTARVLMDHWCVQTSSVQS